MIEDIDIQRKRHAIKRMLPRHFNVLQLILAGHSYVTVAKTLGLSEKAVSLIVQSPVFQGELSRARKEQTTTEKLGQDVDAHLGKARSVLEQAVTKAAETQVQLLSAMDPAIALRASEKILDRVLGETKKGASVAVNITAENIALLNLALKESGAR